MRIAIVCLMSLCLAGAGCEEEGAQNTEGAAAKAEAPGDEADDKIAAADPESAAADPESAESTGDEAGGDEAGAAAGEAPAADGDQCLVGTWQANEFVAILRDSLRDIRGAKLTAASGTITFEFKPPDADNKGELIANANDLIHKIKAKQSGIKVSGTHTMTGQTTMPYQVLADSVLLLDDPTDGEITSKVTVRASGGIRFKKSQSETIDFSKGYFYECDDDKLTVWDHGKKKKKRKRNSLTFDRVK